MNTGFFYSIIFYFFGGTGVIVFIALFFISAPYGRHRREGWGVSLDNRAGWIIMEAVAPAGFLLFFFLGSWKTGYMPYVFLFLWMLHYIYRSFIFSSLIRGRKGIPLTVMFFAIVFNGLNTFLQGRYFYSYAGPAGKYSAEWLGTPQFIIGVLIFLIGFVVHTRSDHILRNLRGPGETEYKIPRGWLFRWVSCPNYLGEIIQWSGWAVLTWSYPGLLFAGWTFFNLFPRALSHHRWYGEEFEEYPDDRKAIIPGII